MTNPMDHSRNGQAGSRSHQARPSTSTTASSSANSAHTDQGFVEDENHALLASQHSQPHAYGTTANSSVNHSQRTSRYPLPRTSSLRSRAISRRSSFSRKTKPSGGSSSYLNLNDSATELRSAFYDDRTWYDQFTSTDWIRDAIADAVRVKELRSRKDLRGRLQATFDGAQGWVLVAIIGVITAGVAYLIDVTETVVFDYKFGYCTTGWWQSKRRCCNGASICGDWITWYGLLDDTRHRSTYVDFVAFVLWVVLLAMLSCLITLATRTNIASHIAISTLDENLGALPHSNLTAKSQDSNDDRLEQIMTKVGPKTYYPAAGSGVAEVKVILSGFVLHGYLGVRTLLCKSVGLIFSVGSGMSVGKEGPYVHIATCVGNIASRLFSKYSRNDAKRREVLSASAAAGVAVAFGAPIGGVLFSLEEVSYYFPPKTLFRTFFCCIVAALSLKFFDPYGTGKIVLFQVRYLSDWRILEIGVFAVLGILGGVAGALFIKACRVWATTFRRLKRIKNSPLLEVFLVALVTGIVSFWNRYTRLPVAELLWELAAPCASFSDTGNGLCPVHDNIPQVIGYLSWALLIKVILTTITFGIKVPAGIYVPSMVIGGLTGRIIGHSLQYSLLENAAFAGLVGCPASDGNPESCVVPGVYALVGAGAMMCGVTRLSVTLAVILFELTGSLEHVLPFSLGVLIAKWTADALEPSSIYDLLTDMNSYPFLDSKVRPIFTTELKDITPSPSTKSYIDVSLSPRVTASSLRGRLVNLHLTGELDGGFPIVEHGVLVGLISAPDLEFALDALDDEDDDPQCLINPQHAGQSLPLRGADDEREQGLQDSENKSNTDMTGYVDAAPIALDISSPMELVFECFVKLGLRYVCVLEHGIYAGMVHKKTFVKYVKDVQHNEMKG